MTAVEAVQPAPRTRPLGLLAIAGAILCFSISSTLIKKAGAPGPTIAFWRMAAASVVWLVILQATEGRSITAADARRAIVPGIAFGLNITFFFTGITHNSIANAEFIGALTPLVLVPAGAILFHERLDRRALAFGAVSLAGLALVLFSAESSGDASWYGNALVLGAMLLWSVYLVSSRGMREGRSVARIMASAMPIATVTILPIVLVSGQVDDVDGRSALFIAMLTVLTGTLAHGFITFGQRSVAIGTISLLQVSQPALAVMWAVIFLDQELLALQLVGMALVIVGLVLVTVRSRRAQR